MTLALAPYQREGATWLGQHPQAYLADEMRLGKTPQSITALDESGATNICVVCPAFLKANWRRETDKWATRPWFQTIVSYDIAARDGLPAGHDAYIFDEAHYLKNPTAKRTKVLLGLDGDDLASAHPLRRASFVWPLSGTPGNPAELWPWLRALGGTDRGYSDFRARYCRLRQTEWGPQVVGLRREHLPELQELLKPFFLRRTARGLGLPEARWGEISLETGVDSSDSRGFKVDAEDDDYRHTEALAKRMRELGEAKAAPLAEVLRYELQTDLDKVVVFAWHRSVLRVLQDELREFGAVRVDGDTNEITKLINIDRFQSDPTCRVFLGQIKCCVGFSLTAAANGVFAEMGWNPEDNAQAARRMIGPDQKRPVLVRVAKSEDPLDFAVTSVNARKTQINQKQWSW